MKHARFNRIAASLMLLVGAFILSMTAFTTQALAESAIGVVNIQKIMNDSKAANAVRDQLQAKQKSFQSELDAKEKALHAEDQALSKARATTSKEAFDQKVKDFSNKAAQAQRDVQTKKAQLDKAFNGALEEIQSNVVDIAKQIASEKKLNIVLTSSQVVYFDSSMDITDDVLKRLNDKLPTVKVSF